MQTSELAVFVRRTPGELRRVALADGLTGPNGEELTAPLWVSFETPSALKLAQVEAATRNAIRDLIAGQISIRRYGLPDGKLTDEEIEGLSTLITAVEFGAALIRDWNFALADEEGAQVQKAPVDLAHVVELLSVRHHRQAWLMHLDQASPLERAEGNASGVSPSTNSGGAPSTAADASESAPPALADGPAEPDGSAAG